MTFFFNYFKMQRYDFFLTCKHFICLVFNTMEDFDEGNEEEAKEERD